MHWKLLIAATAVVSVVGVADVSHAEFQRMSAMQCRANENSGSLNASLVIPMGFWAPSSSVNGSSVICPLFDSGEFPNTDIVLDDPVTTMVNENGIVAFVYDDFYSTGDTNDNNFEVKACKSAYLFGTSCGVVAKTTGEPGFVALHVDPDKVDGTGSNYWSYLNVDLPKDGDNSSQYSYFTGYTVEYE